MLLVDYKETSCQSTYPTHSLILVTHIFPVIQHGCAQILCLAQLLGLVCCNSNISVIIYSCVASGAYI